MSNLKELLSLVEGLSKDNPSQEFFVDHAAGVAGAKHPETGEIGPIFAQAINGGIVAYFPTLVDGKPLELKWELYPPKEKKAEKYPVDCDYADEILVEVDAQRIGFRIRVDGYATSTIHRFDVDSLIAVLLRVLALPVDP